MRLFHSQNNEKFLLALFSATTGVVLINKITWPQAAKVLAKQATRGRKINSKLKYNICHKWQLSNQIISNKIN